jgi:hypothetical protein
MRRDLAIALTVLAAAPARADDDNSRRCAGVTGRLQDAFRELDDGIRELTKPSDYSTAAAARSHFEGAEGLLQMPLREWHAGAPDSCGDAQWNNGFSHKLLDSDVTYTIERWVEKAKQLRGLADERAQTSRPPAAARILEAPRATVAAAPGQLPAKYVDNPQFGCGSLPAWQKTVTPQAPAGDVKLLPGCSQLDDDREGGPTLQVLSGAKRLVMKLDEQDHDNANPKYVAGKMQQVLADLETELAKDVWKTPELDPMAHSFERLLAWERNEMLALPSREEIYLHTHAFAQDFDPKTGAFKGKHYDVYAPEAQACIELVETARDGGVDIESTMVINADNRQPFMTYRAALDLCRAARGGMEAKKKADQEAAAAEDGKWKTLCGGDKYALWKQRGEFALSRGGWDRSRPEEACKASVWYAHYGPDDNQVYDCEKYTFSGNKQVGHVKKSNRWFMVCP